MTTERRQNNRDRLLALLMDGRPHHQRDCLAVGGYRYGARIFELRQEGFAVDTIRLDDDEFAYQLIKGKRRGPLLVREVEAQAELFWRPRGKR